MEKGITRHMENLEQKSYKESLNFQSRNEDTS